MFDHKEELWSKLYWQLKLRWLIVLGLLFFLPISYFSNYSLGPDNRSILLLASILFVSNSLFNIFHYLFSKQKTSHATQKKVLLVSFFSQVCVDYFCTALLVVLTGFAKSNLLILFLPHIVITSIIFERKRVSYVVMWVSLIIIATLAIFYVDDRHDRVFIICFNLFIYHFIFYLTNILSQVIRGQRNELLATNAELINMEQEKQSYTLRATHELKAPFTAIQSYVQIILDGYAGEINDKVRDIFQKIDIRCDSLSKMIKNIIQLSHMRTSSFSNKDYLEVDIAELVNRSCAEFADLCYKRRIKLMFNNQLADGHQEAIIPEMFAIMINNLISNAIRYSKESTKIEVSLNFDDKLKISVKDQGIGIPEKNFEKIFNEHFRCNEAAQFDTTGNGMGLAIVKEVATLHNAEISVDSEVGIGTTFTFIV